MTKSEKSQLIKGLFLTTGAVLGALFYEVDQLTGGVLFAVFSVGIFFAASYMADDSTNTKMTALYISALIVWLGMYIVFQLP